MIDWFEVYKTCAQIKKTTVKDLLDTDKYILWLISFTNSYGNFSDTDWLYKENEISLSDKEFVNYLGDFYNKILNYAISNYINIETEEFKNFYYVKYAGFGLKVGIIYGQGCSFFVDKVKINKDCDFIDYQDIIDNRMSDKTKEINEKLEKFSNMIITLVNENVPINAISDVCDKTLKRTKKFK